MNPPTPRDLKDFGIQGIPLLLPSGEGRTYKVGNSIIKHINTESTDHANWYADFFNSIKQVGFRVPKPISTMQGKWVNDKGWTAWEVLEGNHDFEEHIPESIDAILAFHNAIKNYPKLDFLDKDSGYMRADRYAWGDKPLAVHPKIKDDVEILYGLRQPTERLTEQLIHGDLNIGNILLSTTLLPAIIDIAPYWRPVEFAVAIYAYWVGPWRNHKESLRYFSQIPNFGQMLVRAGIRMLFIMQELDNFSEFEEHHIATGIIKEYLEG